MPNVRASSGTIGTTSSPISLSLEAASPASARTPSSWTPCGLRCPCGTRRSSSGSVSVLSGSTCTDALRHEAAELLPPLEHVGHFRAVVRRPIERRLGDFLVADRDAEAGAERAQLVFVELLLLVGDVLAFARLADAVALDRAREDDGRLPGVLDGGLVRRVHLDRIVAAERELLQLLVGQVLDHARAAADPRPRSAGGRRRRIRRRTSDTRRRRPRPCA